MVYCLPWNKFNQFEFKEVEIVARSTTEVEYQAIATTATELNWFTNLLKELNFNSTLAHTIYYDNVEPPTYTSIQYSPHV